jgi:hypothetical protein
MMRPLGKCLLTLGALALLASPAWAQGRGGFGGFGAGILMAPNVQQDLKLSADQIGKIPDALRANREKHQDELAALRDASPEERQGKMAALTKTMGDEVKKELAFTAEQSKRFDQISLQSRGIQAFADPAVASKLNLTDDQKSKLREIAEAARGQFGQGGFNKDASEEERAEARKKRAETSRANLTKVMNVLTDAQKTSWKELTGTPIEIQVPPRRQN